MPEAPEYDPTPAPADTAPEHLEAIATTEAVLELPPEKSGFGEGNVGEVRARVVAPGANNPVTPPPERSLEARGVVCVPDFVANCGGVLGGTMEFAAVSAPTITAFVDGHFAARVAWLITEAARTNRHSSNPFVIWTRAW